jgi:N-methylhydantoinase A
MGVIIGVDIGGTFTDIVGVDLDSGTLWTHKVPTTPLDHTSGFIDGLQGVLKKMERPVHDIENVIHGTTVGTNAILEKKGAKIGILATEGFEDILYIGRQKRSQMYDLFMDPETPVFLCPRRRVKGIPERMDATGQVLVPLDKESIAQGVKDLVENHGVQSIAVNFLFSFMNSEHEQTAEKIIKQLYPGISVSLSSRVDPQFREYERCCLTAFDAYVRPVVGNYLERLQRRLVEEGVHAPLHIMLSQGGIASVKVTIERAVGTLLSGVAAGVIGGKAAGENVGDQNVITLDVGGTSADVSLVTGSKPFIATEGKIGSFPLRQPMVDVNTIGAGGGSIAFVDEAGNLRVGPQSAGSLPGPVCYGRGGVMPTVTDASLVLGYLSSEGLVGGALPLDKELASEAINRHICQPLNLELTKAASGIHRIINAAMADAVRLVSVQRGYDPRKFSLVAFGGAGGIHACSVASQLGIERVIIPEGSGVLAAYGLIVAEIEAQEWKTYRVATKDLTVETLNKVIKSLEAKCMESIENDGSSETDLQREYVAMMRYVGQSYELPVPLSLIEMNGKVIETAIADFHQIHERVYGQNNRNSETELVSLRVTLRHLVTEEDVKSLKMVSSQLNQPIHHRQVYFDECADYVETPVYPKSLLPKEEVIHGPAIIAQVDTTIIVRPNWSVKLTSNDNLIMERHVDAKQMNQQKGNVSGVSSGCV